MATILKPDLDEAFAQRLHAIVHFTLPTAKQRLQLWKNAFSEGYELDDDVDLQTLAENYELTGSAINNVLRFCAMLAISRDTKRIYRKDILSGIKAELRNGNKT